MASSLPRTSTRRSCPSACRQPCLSCPSLPERRRPASARGGAGRQTAARLRHGGLSWGHSVCLLGDLCQTAYAPCSQAVPLGRMLESRFDVVTAEQLEALTSRALPRGVAGAPERVLYRDLYINTADEILQ